MDYAILLTEMIRQGVECDLSKYIWCEDSKSGYQFWKALFKEVYPDYTIESKRSNSNLSRSVAQINDDGNTYFIMLDTAIDNPDVLREFT